MAGEARELPGSWFWRGAGEFEPTRCWTWYGAVGYGGAARCRRGGDSLLATYGARAHHGSEPSIGCVTRLRLD